VLGSLISRTYVRDLVRNFDESPFLRGKQLAALVVLEAWLHKNIAKNAED
jgi:hypothetical protein